MSKTQDTRARRRPVLFAEVDRELHDSARLQAVKEDRPIARVIEQAVREYLARCGIAKKKGSDAHTSEPGAEDIRTPTIPA